MFKKILLLLAACLLCVGVYMVPGYSGWMSLTVLYPPISYSDQVELLDTLDRMTARYGNSFVVYKQTVGVLDKANFSDAVLLLPPTEYLKKSGVIDVEAVSPLEFYYFTGHKAVWANSPNVYEATWTLVPNRETVMLRRIRSKEDIAALINLYKNYIP